MKSLGMFFIIWKKVTLLSYFNSNLHLFIYKFFLVAFFFIEMHNCVKLISSIIMFHLTDFLNTYNFAERDLGFLANSLESGLSPIRTTLAFFNRFFKKYSKNICHDFSKIFKKFFLFLLLFYHLSDLILHDFLLKRMKSNNDSQTIFLQFLKHFLHECLEIP